MEVPLWNPSSATPSHMISTSTPACVGIVNVNSAPTCTYDTTKRMLTVKSVTVSDILDGSTMTFSVSNFQNPYNGITKSGFQITIYEATGVGKVDDTNSLSVTATQFAVI